MTSAQALSDSTTAQAKLFIRIPARQTNQAGSYAPYPGLRKLDQDLSEPLQADPTPLDVPMLVQEDIEIYSYTLRVEEMEIFVTMFNPLSFNCQLGNFCTLSPRGNLANVLADPLKAENSAPAQELLVFAHSCHLHCLIFFHLESFHWTVWAHELDGQQCTVYNSLK
ncbi:hypothetical protein K439DRAFT_1618517 [Ramaria rubella]|nr:hypothetical protein K439DRAFT_1618517 [Ramaria rubella]